MKWLKKNMHWLMSILLMLVTLTVFGPLELYFTNGKELWFGFGEVVKISLLLTAVGAVLLYGIGFLLKGKVRRIYGAVIFLLAVALYIQGNYANIDYGILDGDAIDWSAFGTYAIVDTVGWVLFLAAGLVLAFKKPKMMKKIQKWGSAFLIFMLVLSLVMIGATSDALKEEKSDFYLSNQNIYQVSENENIIIFVLDAFDDAYYQDVFDDDPEKYTQMFQDFTYFNNASVCAARTKAALPAIITGYAYPGSVTYPQYIANAFDSDGLYSKLNKLGYDVGIYTESVFVPDDAGALIDNQMSSGYAVNSYSGLAKKYFDFTLYKYVPHVLKQFFWLYTDDFDKYQTGADAPSYVTDDAKFYQEMKLTASAEGNAFRLYHLHGAHSPYRLDENAQSVAGGTDLVTNAKGALHIVHSYMDQLKQLGVYDDSTIIIMADHGESNVDYGNDHSAHGILFVKEKNSSKEYTVSDAPVSYFDLHATLLDVLGEENDKTFFDIQSGDRNRLYYLLGTENSTEVYTEYKVSGNLNDSGAVSATGNKFSPDVEKAVYNFGTQLTFGLNANATPYCLGGVSATDPGDYAWTTGKEVVFNFPFKNRPTNDLIVTLDIMTVYNQFGSQSVRIYANGAACYSDVLSSGKEITFTVPVAALNADSLELRLELPDAVCPKDHLGPGADARTLALAIRGLRIDQSSASEVTQYTANTTLTFGENGNAAPFVFSGINLSNENDYSWTDGRLAVMNFRLDTVPTDGILVQLDVMTVLKQATPQRVIILANGTQVYEDALSEGKNISFTVPNDAITGNLLSLSIQLPDAASPYELTGSGDRRVLSLALRSIILQYGAAQTQPGTDIETPKEGFQMTDIIGIPLGALLGWCYQLLGNYGLAIIVFTFLTKVILFPVSMWVQKNGIAMVKLTPDLNRLKIKYYGDKDTIADETQLLYKRENYHPLASTIPMIIQLVMLMGVIGAVKNTMGDADTILTAIPSEAGGLTYLMPLGAGVAALALGLAQNKLNPLQREQGKSEQWMTNGFSIAISLFLGAFVSLGVGIYWICSNLFSILQQIVLNAVIKPEKYIDYEDLAASKKELAAIENVGSGVSKEDKKREKADYKRFFSVANKHLVFYSEKSGFYKYFKDVIDYLLEKSNVIIHYVTSDPKDQIFKIAETQPRIKPYYIGENKLITLMMKMDADIVVMTCPDLNRFHLKRSYVRKDIEYIYMFHYPLSTHMVLNTGALDHYDTIFCVGEFQFDEIRAAERVYELPEKKLIAAGYGQLEQLDRSYQAMEKVTRKNPKILIAPSWQPDNILDSCIDPMLEQLLGKGYEVVVRPHPEYVKRYKPRMDKIVERYAGREADGLKFELDFTSNNSVFDSDILITDWSGTAYEFSFVTLKPSVFIDTKPKINNPEYVKLGIEPLEFGLRSQVGIQVAPDQLEGLDQKINELLANGEQYADKILGIRNKYIANFGTSGVVGGKYILRALKDRKNKA